MVATSSTLETLSLSSVDLAILVDQSGSMNSELMSGVSRWQFMLEWLKEAVQEAIKHDQDGITLGFFNHQAAIKNNVNSVADFDAFINGLTPGGNTMMGAALAQIVDAWFAQMQADANTKPLRVLVFTDGEATDAQNLKSSIISWTNKMSQMGLADHHLAISFIQVGNDSAAASFLQSLDELKNVPFDIIDTKDSNWVMGHTFAQLVAAAEAD